jgi:hypothetical protein
MVDRREMFHDIQAQYVSIVPGKLLQTVNCTMRTFAFAIGITITDETRLEPGLDNIADRMMYDPITKRGCTDFAPFRLIHVEVSVRPGQVTPILQFVLQIQQIIGPIRLEGRYGVPATLSNRGSIGRFDQVIPFIDLIQPQTD